MRRFIRSRNLESRLASEEVFAPRGLGYPAAPPRFSLLGHSRVARLPPRLSTPPLPPQQRMSIKPTSAQLRYSRPRYSRKLFPNLVELPWRPFENFLRAVSNASLRTAGCQRAQQRASWNTLEFRHALRRTRRITRNGRTNGSITSRRSSLLTSAHESLTRRLGQPRGTELSQTHPTQLRLTAGHFAALAHHARDQIVGRTGLGSAATRGPVFNVCCRMAFGNPILKPSPCSTRLSISHWALIPR
jgi:hypothetical protein